MSSDTFFIAGLVIRIIALALLSRINVSSLIYRFFLISDIEKVKTNLFK